MVKGDYQEIARLSRIKVLNLIYLAQTSHIGSVFSCADILAVLMEKIDLDKDRFILSAGWKAAMLYYHLWRKGRITQEELDSYCMLGSKFIGLAEPIHPDIPLSGGSMGFGLPGAVGFALAKKMDKQEGRVYCLMSDGEMQIGTTWESALLAAKYKLDNLIVIVDKNSLQAMGKVEDILPIESLENKWLAFNWNVIEIDGHNYEEVEDALKESTPDHPLVIIARTTKGKGVSFMENNNLFHYKAPDETEFNLALEELNKR